MSKSRILSLVLAAATSPMIVTVAQWPTDPATYIATLRIDWHSPLARHTRSISRPIKAYVYGRLRLRSVRLSADCADEFFGPFFIKNDTKKARAGLKVFFFL